MKSCQHFIFSNRILKLSFISFDECISQSFCNQLIFNNNAFLNVVKIENNCLHVCSEWKTSVDKEDNIFWLSVACDYSIQHNALLACLS